MKYAVDGSEGALPSGVAVGQSVYDEHMALAGYLANRQLAVDMWDGESLLQVGAWDTDAGYLRHWCCSVCVAYDTVLQSPCQCIEP